MMRFLQPAGQGLSREIQQVCGEFAPGRGLRPFHSGPELPYADNPDQGPVMGVVT